MDLDLLPPRLLILLTDLDLLDEHHRQLPGEGLQLQGRQGAARGGEEPVGVGLEQPQVKVDLGEVGLVLGGGGGPGPDGRQAHQP